MANDIFVDNDDKPVVRHGNNYVDADELTDFIHWIIVFIAIPTISIMGVIGNSFSIIVLAKHGLTKSSNILLFSLAISDIVYMVGINGPPKVMYEWGRGGFQYPETEARILYYLYHFFDTLNWGSGPTSLCIPVLITIERFVAVFLPLKFPFIITRRRTIIAVIIPNVLFYGIQAYVRFWFRFAYVFDPARNATVGMAVRSDWYWEQREVSKYIAYFFNCMIVMVAFVGSGCVAIGIKVSLAARKRLKMTSGKTQEDSKPKNDAGTSRTTKTLLCLCTFYTFACAFVTLPAIIPDVMVFPIFVEDPNFRSVGVFVYHIFKLVLSINASCNFYIYVVMNKKFRDTFLELMPCRQKK